MLLVNAPHRTCLATPPLSLPLTALDVDATYSVLSPRPVSSSLDSLLVPLCEAMAASLQYTVRRSWRMAALSLLFAVLAHCPGGVLPFKPTGPAGHSGLVNMALSAAKGTDVNGKSYRFSSSQIGHAQTGVIEVDVSLNFFDTSYHCDDDDIEQCSNRISKERADLLVELFAASASVYQAIPLPCYAVQYHLGQMLHTLQDFYAHSNWVDSHGTTQNPNIGTDSAAIACRSCHQCPTSPWLLSGPDASELTTGYYNPAYAADYLADVGPFKRFALCNLFQTFPDGKCLHGYDDTDVHNNCDGISKDIATREPDHPYGRAFSVAMQHTTEFVQDLVDEIDDPDQLQCLMHSGAQVGFCIDTTGSMGSVIAAVEASVLDIAGTAVMDAESGFEPTFLLETFNDPAVGTPSVYSDLSQFSEAVGGLTADGGGDCPEFSLSGVIAAAQAADSGATIYMFTDASSKDADLSTVALDLIAQKEIDFFPVVFGSCSPYDPAYFLLAESTQGHVFVLERDDVSTLSAQISALVRPRLQPNRTSLVIIHTLLTNNSAWDTSVLLDSTSSFATFTVTADDKSNVSLFSPSGVELTGSNSVDPSLTVNTSYAYQVTLPTVEAGHYVVSVLGQGSAALSVTASTALQLTSLYVAELGGRHYELVPKQSAPVALQSTTLLFSLSATMAALSVANVTELQLDATDSPVRVIVATTANEAILSLPAVPYQDDELSASSQWTVTFPCPVQPFRVQVLGQLSSTGQLFQRTWTKLLTPQLVSIRLPALYSMLGGLAVGSTTSIPFNVTSTAQQAGSYQLSVSFSPIALPVSLSILQRDQSGALQWVDLMPPVNADATAFVLRANTTSTLGEVPGGSALSNSSVAIQLPAASTSTLSLHVFVPAVLLPQLGKRLTTLLTVTQLGSSAAVTSVSFDSVLVGCTYNSSAAVNVSLSLLSACPNTQCDMAAQNSSTAPQYGAFAPLPTSPPTSALVQTFWVGSGGAMRTIDCQCTANWTGAHCELPRCPSNCTSAAHGSCGTSPSVGCVCEPGWAGPDCSVSAGPLSLRLSVSGADGDDPLDGLPGPVAVSSQFDLWVAGLPTTLPLYNSDPAVQCSVDVVDASDSSVLATYPYAISSLQMPSSAVGLSVRAALQCSSPSGAAAYGRLPLPLLLSSNVLHFNGSLPALNVSLQLSTGQQPSDRLPPTLSSCSNVVLTVQWDDPLLTPASVASSSYSVCIVGVRTGDCVLFVGYATGQLSYSFHLNDSASVVGELASDSRYAVAVSRSTLANYSRSAAFLLSFAWPASDVSLPAPFDSGPLLASCQLVAGYWMAQSSQSGTVRLISADGSVAAAIDLYAASVSVGYIDVAPTVTGAVTTQVTQACQRNSDYSALTSTQLGEQFTLQPWDALLNAHSDAIAGWQLRLFLAAQVSSDGSVPASAIDPSLEVDAASTLAGCAQLVLAWTDLLAIDSAAVQQALSSAQITLALVQGDITVDNFYINVALAAGSTVVQLPSELLPSVAYSVTAALSFPYCTSTTAVDVQLSAQSVDFYVSSSPSLLLTRTGSIAPPSSSVTSLSLPLCSNSLLLSAQLSYCASDFGYSYPTAATRLSLVDGSGSVLGELATVSYFDSYGGLLLPFSLAALLPGASPNDTDLPLAATLAVNVTSSLGNGTSAVTARAITLLAPTAPTVTWGRIYSSAINVGSLAANQLSACSPLLVSWNVSLTDAASCGGSFAVSVWDGSTDTQLADESDFDLPADGRSYSLSLTVEPWSDLSTAALNRPLQLRLTFYGTQGRLWPLGVFPSPSFTLVAPPLTVVSTPPAAINTASRAIARFTAWASSNSYYAFDSFLLNDDMWSIVSSAYVAPLADGYLEVVLSPSFFPFNGTYFVRLQSYACGAFDSWNSSSQPTVVALQSTQPSSAPLTVNITGLPSLAALFPCWLPPEQFIAGYFARTVSVGSSISWVQSRADTCGLLVYLVTDGALSFSLTASSPGSSLGEVSLPIAPIDSAVPDLTAEYRVSLVNECDSAVLATSEPLSLSGLTGTALTTAALSDSAIPPSAFSSFSASVFAPSFTSVWSVSEPIPAIQFRLLGIVESYPDNRNNPLPSCPGLPVLGSYGVKQFLFELLDSTGAALLNLTDTLQDEGAICALPDGVYCSFTPDVLLASYPSVTSGTYMVRVRTPAPGWFALSSPFSVVSNASSLTTSALTFRPSFNALLGDGSGRYYTTSALAAQLLDASALAVGVQAVTANSTVQLSWTWTGNILAVSLSLWQLTAYTVTAANLSARISPPLDSATPAGSAVLLQSLASNVLNSGSLSWQLPATLSPSHLYAVQLAAAAPVSATAQTAPLVVSSYLPADQPPSSSSSTPPLSSSSPQPVSSSAASSASSSRPVSPSSSSSSGGSTGRSSSSSSSSSSGRGEDSSSSPDSSPSSASGTPSVTAVSSVSSTSSASGVSSRPPTSNPVSTSTSSVSSASGLVSSSSPSASSSLSSSSPALTASSSSVPPLSSTSSSWTSSPQPPPTSAVAAGSSGAEQSSSSPGHVGAIVGGVVGGVVGVCLLVAALLLCRQRAGKSQSQSHSFSHPSSADSSARPPAVELDVPSPLPHSADYPYAEAPAVEMSNARMRRAPPLPARLAPSLPPRQ